MNEIKEDTLDYNEENSITKPNIQFNSLLEWENIKEQAYQNIKNCFSKMIVDNKKEYNNGLTAKQRYYIGISVENALNLITKMTCMQWVYKTIQLDIMYNIYIFTTSIVDAGAWNIVYNKLTPQVMGDIIYNIIVSKLDDIIENISQIKCSRCNKYYERVKINDRGECLTCR